MTFLTKEQVIELFKDFEIIEFKEVEKDGTKKYSIHILKTAINNKQYWFYDTYVLDPDTNDYVKDYSGRYPYSFTNR